MIPTPYTATAAQAAARVSTLRGVGLQLRRVCRVLYGALQVRGADLADLSRHYSVEELDGFDPWIRTSASSDRSWIWLYLYGCALAERWQDEHPHGRAHGCARTLRQLGRANKHPAAPHLGARPLSLSNPRQEVA